MTKINFAASFLFSLCLSAVSFHANPDPFSRYRPSVKRSINIQATNLKYFGEAERLIREKLAMPLSPREMAILAGIHYLVVFADDDSKFDAMFSDFMLLFNVLANSENRHHQREVVKLVIRLSLERAEKKLAKLFGRDEGSRWKFITMLQAITHHKQFEESYFKFYRDNFGPTENQDDNDNLALFRNAMARADYKLLFDILVGAAFLHYSMPKISSDIDLPKDRFQEYLKEFAQFNYIKDHPVYTPQFRWLGYLATHIPLVQTNYGEYVIEDGAVKDKVQAYIDHTIDDVENKLGDFDLFAEYVQCIKILSHGRDSRIPRFEEIILELQRQNGSWGSEYDFRESPYTGIHPTGAALMALNQSNLE